MSSKKIVLQSSDGESFEVEEVVARKLQVVGHMIDDDCADKPIPLQNVTGKILAMVVEYCKKHVDDDQEESEEAKNKETGSTSEEAEKLKKDWDKEFMRDLDTETVFTLILAANYLNVKGLLDLTCQNVADYIKDLSVEDVRDLFNIENDFTAEEEDKIRKENAWAFE